MDATWLTIFKNHRMSLFLGRFNTLSLVAFVNKKQRAPTIAQSLTQKDTTKPKR